MSSAQRSVNFRAIVDQRQCALSDELARILPEKGEFTWELGCGHGHFLTAYATAHPEKLCIGVDIVSERIERARKKRERAGLANLHFLRAEGTLFLETLPATLRLSEVFILFPDPWPKARHHKHRILQSAFLGRVATAAAEECRLHFRTDFTPYFEEAHALVAQHPRWQVTDVPWPFEFETVFQSRSSSHHSFSARCRPTGP